MPLIRVIEKGDVVPDRSRQLDPPSVEYWYLVIEDPVFVPAEKATDKLLSPGVILEIVGAPGVPSGRKPKEPDSGPAAVL
jgi:hypothetical protein